jgi:hypothetical protein
MKIYAAGWALQSPALNFFKRFLRLNPSVSLSGILYPKKIPEDIEGIPIFDFDSAQRILGPGDIVLDCHRPAVANEALRAAFVEFFASQGIKTTSVADFLRSLVERDRENRLRFPVDGVKSQDIRELLTEAPFEFVRDRFADLESFEVANRLDGIARSSDWDRMLEFDKDETTERALFDVISNLHGLGLSARFRLLDTAGIFLNALLKLRVQQPEAAFSVELTEPLSSEMGPRFEFYRRSLGIGLASTAGNSLDAVLLGGEMNTILEAYEKDKKVSPSVFFLRRSILNYRKFQNSLNVSEYRILLRQPDTSPENLITALLV